MLPGVALASPIPVTETHNLHVDENIQVPASPRPGADEKTVKFSQGSKRVTDHDSMDSSKRESRKSSFFGFRNNVRKPPTHSSSGRIRGAIRSSDLCIDSEEAVLEAAKGFYNMVDKDGDGNISKEGAMRNAAPLTVLNLQLPSLTLL